MTGEVRGRQRHTFIVGVNDKESGPVRLLQGRNVEDMGEIVIDNVFARKEEIGVGDTLTVAGTPLQVVGIAQGGNCFLYQYAFVTIAQARQLLGLESMVNYFLVQLAENVSPQDAVTRIEQTSSLVSAYTKEQFIANNLSLTGDNFLPILRVLEVIGVLVGAVVIGLTVYTLTVERSAEYGVLKAIGASNGTLYKTVACPSTHLRSLWMAACYTLQLGSGRGCAILRAAISHLLASSAHAVGAALHDGHEFACRDCASAAHCSH